MNKTELKKQINQLKKVSGNGTELISVYIPAGKAISEMANRLRNELSQSSNIKDKTTRKNVGEALARILHALSTRGYSAPESGLAIFCSDELVSVEPPEPVDAQIYRCGNRFFLEPLERMIEPKKSYGIIALDGREASIVLLKGTSFTVLDTLTCLAHSKCGKGGQSKRRFERIREESIEFYYKRIGEHMRILLDKTNELIIGGPGPAKEDFVKLSPFDYRFKVLGVVHAGYTDEQGIREILSQSESLIGEQEAIVEKKEVDNFFREARNDGLIEYGLDVKDRIDENNVKRLLISETLTDKFKEFIKTAEDKHVDIAYISNDSQDGQMFLQTFGGIGAYLKYRKK